MITLNPLVVNFERTSHSTDSNSVDSPEQSTYLINDEINMFGTYKMTVNYEAVFRRTSDGINTDIKAGAWTTTYGKWRVIKRSTEETEIIEEATIRAPFIFMPFIINTLSKAHTSLMERLVETAEKAHRDISES